MKGDTRNLDCSAYGGAQISGTSTFLGVPVITIAVFSRLLYWDPPVMETFISPTNCTRSQGSAHHLGYAP